MSHHFSWYELNTTDPKAAQAFYGAVVGWTTQAWEHQPDYTMIVGAEGPVGAITTLPEGAKAMGAPPHWLAYVSVRDIDATVAKITAAGGAVHVPPMALPNDAKIAIVADPSGAAFGLHQSNAPTDQVPNPQAMGNFSWNELMSTDPDKALAFYKDVFGWVDAGSMEMGEGMGTYHLFGGDAQNAFGGAMRAPPGMPSAWCYYATVPSAEASIAQVTAHGGTMLHGPMQVPGGGWIGMFKDPQGAVGAVFAMAK